MFCSKCGKRIEENATICEECSKQTSDLTEIKQEEKPSKKVSKKEMRLAIVCFVTSIIALVVVLVAFGFLFPIMLSVAQYGYTNDSITHLIIYWVATVLLMAVSIFTLILGIRAVKSFVRAKANKEEVKVVMLVFGIISIALSGFVLIYAFVLMMFPMIMLITRIIPTVTINGVSV